MRPLNPLSTLIRRASPVIVCLSLAALACSIPGVSTTPATEVAATVASLLTAAPSTQAAAPSVTAPATPAGPIESVQIDPCALLTPSEAEAVLGEPVRPPASSGGACLYSDAASGRHVVSAYALQGEQAKDTFSYRLFLLGAFGLQTDPATVDELKALDAAGDQRGVVEKLIALSQGNPAFSSRKVDGLGDTALWAWKDLGNGVRQGFLITVKGDVVAGTDWVVGDSIDETAAFQGANVVVTRALTRLPPKFTFALPTAAPTPEPPAIVPVPSSEIQIEGISFLSYQLPGDPFRFVCEQPCGVDQTLLFGQYNGFHNAYEIMLNLTGVDILPEMMPVDIHANGDDICGHLGDGPLGYTDYYPPKKPVICSYLFDYAQGFNGEPYTPEFATRVDQQNLFIHEYLHLVFMGRLPRVVEAIHDFVTPLAIYISFTGQSENEIDPCTYHPQSPPGDYGGYLLQNLCTQNNFRLEDLAAVMIEMDRVYQSGAGQVQQDGFEHPSLNPAQFRQILNEVTGSDTRQAFMDACWPASLFGDNYTLSDACLYPTPMVTPTPIK